MVKTMSLKIDHISAKGFIVEATEMVEIVERVDASL